jgi:hypothetical protein
MTAIRKTIKKNRQKIKKNKPKRDKENFFSNTENKCKEKKRK